MGIFPNIRDENKIYLEPPPRKNSGNTPQKTHMFLVFFFGGGGDLKAKEALVFRGGELPPGFPTWKIVDGWNPIPKQPPFRCKKPKNPWDFNYRSLNWCFIPDFRSINVVLTMVAIVTGRGIRIPRGFGIAGVVPNP